MKHATIAATILSTLALFAGPASAQQWGGVAGIATGFGYSASPSLSMTPQSATVPVDEAEQVPARAPVADPQVASGSHRSGGSVLRRVAAARHTRHIFASRSAARPSVLARAKRIGVKRRARIA